MEKFKKNSNKLNGLTVRQSDMPFELKNEITEVFFINKLGYIKDNANSKFWWWENIKNNYWLLK